MNKHEDRQMGGAARHGRMRRGLLGILAVGCLVGMVGCALFGNRSSSKSREPSWSSCVTGGAVEKVQNCGEYCASQNMACQNNGCGHISDPSTRYAGAAYDNSICSGNAVRSYQCLDPFLQDGAVRCCCVGM